MGALGEPIRSVDGRILGWVKTASDGSRVLRNFSGQVLGTYDKRADVTRDFYGRITARGDALTTLLR